MNTKLGVAFCFLIALLCSALAVAPCHAMGDFPNESGFMKMFERSKPVGEPPFELPESLPGGGVKKFHRATSQQTYEYSQGGCLWVFRYDDAAIAVGDFRAFAKGGERVDEKVSVALSKQEACVTKQRDATTLWFVLDDSIVGIQLPREQWSLLDVAKTAEELLKRESERAARLFGEPERTLQTFFRAIEKSDEAQILRCLTTGGDEDTQRRLGVVKQMLPMMRFAMIEQMGRRGMGDGEFPMSRPRIGKSERLPDGQVMVPVRINQEMGGEMVWLELLRFAAGLEQGGMGIVMGMGGMPRMQDDNQVWIPMSRVGERWAINLSTLNNSAFTKTVQSKQDRDCFANLRQILMALKAYANDNIQEQKFPPKLSVLLKDQYINDPKIFSAPSNPNKVQRAEEVDEKSDYVYEGAGEVDDGDGDFIIIYDKPTVHENKGRHVGFADGHIQWVSEEEFQRMLDVQKRMGRDRPRVRRVEPMPMPFPMPGDGGFAPPGPPTDDDTPQAMPEVAPGRAPRR